MMKVEIWFDIGKDWTDGIVVRGFQATKKNEMPYGAVSAPYPDSYHYMVSCEVPDPGGTATKKIEGQVIEVVT